MHAHTYIHMLIVMGPQDRPFIQDLLEGLRELSFQLYSWLRFITIKETQQINGEKRHKESLRKSVRSQFSILPVMEYSIEFAFSSSEKNSNVCVVCTRETHQRLSTPNFYRELAYHILKFQTPKGKHVSTNHVVQTIQVH